MGSSQKMSTKVPTNCFKDCLWTKMVNLREFNNTTFLTLLGLLMWAKTIFFEMRGHLPNQFKRKFSKQIGYLAGIQQNLLT